MRGVSQFHEHISLFLTWNPPNRLGYRGIGNKLFGSYIFSNSSEQSRLWNEAFISFPIEPTVLETICGCRLSLVFIIVHNLIMKIYQYFDL